MALWTDVRHGFRIVRRNPRFSLLVALTLGLAIGLASAVFSMVNVLLLHDLPYPEPSRIVEIRQANPTRGLSQQLVTIPDYLDWKRDNRVFEDMAAWNFQYFNLTGRDQPERVEGLIVTAGFFPLLGITAQLGRTFLPDEEQPGRAHAAILSDGLWRRRFGADRAIVGRQITVEGEPYTVVGILPPGFRLFRVLNRELDLYVPNVLDALRSSRTNHVSFVYARLKPGVSVEQSRAAMGVYAEAIAQQHPDTNAGWTVEVRQLQQQWTAQIRPVLWMLELAVGLVLLIACTNAAGLLLSRAVARSKEMAIRTALGARRLRLVVQLLVESCVLGLIGGAAGVALALILIQALNHLPYTAVNRVEAFRLDWRVLAFEFGIALFTGIAAGLGPAIQSSTRDLKPDIVHGRRMCTMLVFVESALAVVLLASAGLMMRSSVAAIGMDRGLHTRNLLTGQVWLPPARYHERARIAAFWREAAEKIAALPGVLGATAVNFPPLSVLWTSVGVRIEGAAVPRPGEEPQTQYWVIGPDYFRVSQIPLVAGREFTEHDDDEAHGVVIVSAAMARRFWPGQSALGKRIQPNFPSTTSYWLPKSANNWLTVVGVVGDVRLDGIVQTPLPQMYLPYAQNPSSIMHLMVRTAGDPLSWAPMVRHEIAALDQDQPVFDMRSEEDILAAGFAQAGVATKLMAGFAGIAMILAVIGVYSTIAYFVSQRTKEIGIRMALGARPSEVVRLMARQGLAAASGGVLFGVAGAYVGRRVLRGLLVGVSTIDVPTLATVTAIFLATAAWATYLPALRAARIDPTAALRHE